MLDIASDQRRALRANAHALNPVVAISQNESSESRFDRDKHQPHQPRADQNPGLQ